MDEHGKPSKRLEWTMVLAALVLRAFIFALVSIPIGLSFKATAAEPGLGALGVALFAAGLFWMCEISFSRSYIAAIHIILDKSRGRELQSFRSVFSLLMSVFTKKELISLLRPIVFWIGLFYVFFSILVLFTPVYVLLYWALLVYLKKFPGKKEKPLKTGDVLKFGVNYVVVMALYFGSFLTFPFLSIFGVLFMQPLYMILLTDLAYKYHDFRIDKTLELG